MTRIRIGIGCDPVLPAGELRLAGFGIEDRGSRIEKRRRRKALALRSSILTPRPAYTLFELILAIALSATLLVLIGTAINLYLVRVDTSRQRVEEAQLARSILAMIAADLRATAVYQPQDTSAVAQLAANAAAFDVDEIDQPGGGSSGRAVAGGGRRLEGRHWWQRIIESFVWDRRFRLRQTPPVQRLERRSDQ